MEGQNQFDLIYSEFTFFYPKQKKMKKWNERKLKKNKILDGYTEASAVVKIKANLNQNINEKELVESYIDLLKQSNTNKKYLQFVNENYEKENFDEIIEDLFYDIVFENNQKYRGLKTNQQENVSFASPYNGTPFKEGRNFKVLLDLKKEEKQYVQSALIKFQNNLKEGLNKQLNFPFSFGFDNEVLIENCWNKDYYEVEFNLKKEELDYLNRHYVKGVYSRLNKLYYLNFQTENNLSFFRNAKNFKKLQEEIRKTNSLYNGNNKFKKAKKGVRKNLNYYFQ